MIGEFINNNHILQIYGSGSEEEKLRKLIGNSNERITIFPTISNYELIQKFCNTKYFVISSHFEGNPKVVLEAISRGTLIIAKKNKNIAEVITNGLNGILYENENEIIDKITYFLENESELNKLVNKAYDLIVENNSIEKIVERELNIFNQN